MKMVSNEIETELRTQFATWAGAYRNIGSYSDEIAVLQIRIGELQELIEAEEHIQETAQAIIDAMLADVDDSESNTAEIEKMMVEEIGPAIVKGFVS